AGGFRPSQRRLQVRRGLEAVAACYQAVGENGAGSAQSAWPTANFLRLLPGNRRAGVANRANALRSSLMGLAGLGAGARSPAKRLSRSVTPVPGQAAAGRKSALARARGRSAFRQLRDRARVARRRESPHQG